MRSALQQIAAMRGAVNGLMPGVLESHLREAFMTLSNTTDAKRASIDEVSSLVRTYLKQPPLAHADDGTHLNEHYLLEKTL